MHKRLEDTLALVDHERARLRETVERIGEDGLQRRASAETWSAGELLEHIAITEGAIVGHLSKALAAAKEAGLEPEQSTESILAALSGISEKAKAMKFTAPAHLHPSGTKSAADALAALDASHAQLLASLESVDGLNLEPIAFPHPAFGPLNAYQWVVMLAKHMERHTDQMLVAAAGDEAKGETAP